MNGLTIANTAVRQDTEGRYSLNDLHRAAGGESRHTPGRFTITQQFRDLAEEISRNQDSPPSTSDAGVGTFVAKELVYAYAMWISPKFHLQVIRAYDAQVTAPALPDLADPAALRGLLLGYTEKVLALEATVAAQQPAVEFVEAVADATNCQTIEEVGKSFGLSHPSMFKELRMRGVLLRNNLPAQAQLDAMRFKVITKKREDPGGQVHIYQQTLVTGIGLIYLQKLMARREVAA